jgi:beta-galactosidase/beta-glucuronidase
LLASIGPGERLNAGEAMPTIAADCRDHPRPDRRRSGWMSLNGPWAFGFDDADVGLARGWSERSDAFDRSIVVPFVPQCAASGVGDAGRHEILWYRRVFENPAGPGERLLLHFGAVDHEATVWVNGVEVGRHRGGYTPFSFDVTDRCVPGENALVVRAVDRFRPDQVRGKQAPTFPYLISYTAASGIWQSVWLEVTGPSSIGDLEVQSDAASGRLGVVATVRGEASDAMLEVRVSREGRAVAAAAGQAGALVTLDVPEPSLWSPAAPTLYDVELVLRAPDGEGLDHLHTYTGFRSVEIRDGRWLLNGEPVFQRLLLARVREGRRLHGRPQAPEDRGSALAVVGGPPRRAGLGRDAVSLPPRRHRRSSGRRLPARVGRRRATRSAAPGRRLLGALQ